MPLLPTSASQKYFRLFLLFFFPQLMSMKAAFSPFLHLPHKKLFRQTTILHLKKWLNFFLKIYLLLTYLLSRAIKKVPQWTKRRLRFKNSITAKQHQHAPIFFINVPSYITALQSHRIHSRQRSIISFECT